MTMDAGPDCSAAPNTPPATWAAMLRQLGPGLIISATIVGSGELIVTPKLGAAVGFTLLWFIILGCFIKVFVQIELGRYAVATGQTTLEAMNSIPGPRWRVSWLVWLWLLMYIALVFQVAGMIGGVASIFQLAGLRLSEHATTVMIGALTAVLLLAGRYRLVERLSMVLVAIFTVCTLVAVGALQTTQFAISPAQLLSGFSFHLPSDFTIAFAAFGVIGVGASELIYYPYWCLEKGYARHVGPAEDSTAWTVRAQGWVRVMRLDAWVSCLIYTVATLAFYLLGAAVLHAQGLEVRDEEMIARLSRMYLDTFGPWSFWLFLAGAVVVLYSTIFAATAANARLFADALSVFRIIRYRGDEHRMNFVRIGCVLLIVACVLVYFAWGKPVSLVIVGALAQGLMLPFLALAALYFHFRRTPPSLRAGRLWVAGLWFAALAMGAVGLYQVLAVLT